MLNQISRVHAASTLLRLALCAGLVFASRVATAEEAAKPAPEGVPTAQVLRQLLDVPGGLTPSWKFDSAIPQGNSLLLQFRFRMNGELLLLSVVPPQLAPKGAPASEKFAVELAGDARGQHIELAKGVINRLSLLDPQWRWPPPATLQPVNAPAPPPAQAEKAPEPGAAKPSSGTDGWVIPAGKESAVLAFLSPLQKDPKLSAQYELDAISVNKNHLALQWVDKNTKAASKVALYHPTAKIEGATTLGPVKLAADASTPPALLAGLKEGLPALDAKQAPWIFVTEPASTGGSMKMSPFLSRISGSFQRVGSTWSTSSLILMALLLLASIITAGRQLKATPSAGRWLLALSGITLLGFLVRAKFAPQTFFPELNHVSDRVEMLLRGGSAVSYYGVTGPALYRLVNGFFGGEELAVFRTNLVLASLTVPLVALLDLALFRSWPRALLTAFVFSVLPIHVRFSAGDDLSIPGLFFAVWSVMAFVQYWNTRQTWALVAATAGLVLAANTRPELVLLPLVLAGYVLLVRPVGEWRQLQQPAFLVATAYTALNILFRVLIMPRGDRLGFGNAMLNQVAGARPFSGIALFERSLVPPVLVLMVLVGIYAAFAAREKRVTFWLLGSATLFIVALVTTFKGPAPSHLRTQLITLPFLIIVAVNSVRVLIQHIPLFTRTPALSWAAVAVLLVVGFATRTKALVETGDVQQEWAFLRDKVASLPKGPGVLLSIANEPASADATSIEWRMDLFPQFLLQRHDKDLKVVDLEKIALNDDWPTPDATNKVFYYEGMYCYSFVLGREQEVKKIHPRCQTIRDRYELKPIATESIPGPGSALLGHAPPPYTLGLYEIVGVRSPEATPTAAIPATP
jgi:hypothetical protein